VPPWNWYENRPAATYRFCLVLVLLFSVSKPTCAATYWVATTGVNHPSRGQDPEAPWKTISYAASRVNYGDIVYVKQGFYDSVNDGSLPAAERDSNGVVIEDDNVQFIGYYNSPGDLDDGDEVPDTYETFSSHFAVMPIIVGTNRASGDGFNAVNREDVVIKNFGVHIFEFGVRLSGENCFIENIVGSQFGNVANIPGLYNGVGFGIVGDSHYISNCVVLNAGGEGFSLHVSNSVIVDCEAYADDNSTGKVSAMDYYFLIIGEQIPSASGNYMANCRCERRLDPISGTPPAHGGHGFVIQGYFSLEDYASNNLIQDCSAVNLEEPFVLRGYGVWGNKMLHCTSDVTFPATTGCITISGGPAANTFSRMRLSNSAAAMTVIPQIAG
jgi:hypothetical protein